MLSAYQRTAALQAAIELELFAAIGDGPSDVEAIARRCSASERGIRILCDFLTIQGILTKQAECYRMTPVSAAFLDPRSPASLASIAKFMGNPVMREPYRNLAQVVRLGRTTMAGEGSVDPDHPVWVQFAEAMPPLMRPVSKALSGIVLAEEAGPMRVLDIAASHGLFGIEIARQNPQARITALDWKAVLEVASRNAQAAGVGDRYELLPGSAFDVDFGTGYDVVLLTNFLHHFDPSTCIGLLQKVHAALAPGGRAVALEFVPNEDRVSPPVPAEFSLTMLTSTVAGDAYTFSELSTMYTEAGFVSIAAHHPPFSVETIVIGRAGNTGLR